jgi:hypothetical protein
MLDFLLDDSSEDNAESEITALLFTTQYKLFTYQVMSCHIHNCYSVIVVQSFC